MDIEINECLELAELMDIANICQEINECESDMEFEDRYEIDESTTSNDERWEVSTDLSFSDESDNDLELSDCELEDQSDILQCFINIIELDCILNSNCDDKQLKRRKKRWGVHPINQLRKELGHFENLINEMLIHDHDKFFNYTRMSPEIFDHLLNLIAPKITKSAPNAIPAKFRLLLTLR